MPMAYPGRFRVCVLQTICRPCIVHRWHLGRNCMSSPCKLCKGSCASTLFPAGPTVQQNAEQILPVAFRLLEAAVEVLATDAEGAAALDAK